MPATDEAAIYEKLRSLGIAFVSIGHRTSRSRINARAALRMRQVRPRRHAPSSRGGSGRATRRKSGGAAMPILCYRWTKTKGQSSSGLVAGNSPTSELLVVGIISMSRGSSRRWTPPLSGRSIMRPGLCTTSRTRQCQHHLQHHLRLLPPVLSFGQDLAPTVADLPLSSHHAASRFALGRRP